ncbi:MAG: hypothetical protein AB1646_01615 [Thermodesulfobacteriota bacterium]
MTQKIKRAITVMLKEHVIFECPYCGQSLVRSSHQKAREVLEAHGGKGLVTCPKCANNSVLSMKGTALDNGKNGHSTEP